MTEDELYIPTGVQKNSELFPGFGTKELMQTIVASAFFVLIAALLWAASGNVTAPIVLLLIGVIGSVMMTGKSSTLNQSAIGMLLNLVKFRQGQKIFRYQYQEEWRRDKYWNTQ